MAQRGKAPSRLTPASCRSAVELLRSTFDCRPSLRNRIGKATGELLRLTEEQYIVLDSMAENERCFIKGAAGTGKTLLALEEARRLAAEGKHVLLCCYNRNLAHLLKTAVSDVDLIEATTLHSFMWREIREAGLEDELPDADEDALNSVFVPEVCCDALLARDRLEVFDVVVVDEGQDLMSEEFLEVIGAVLKGGLAGGEWRVFYDPNQDLFTGIRPAGVTRLLGCVPAKHTLMINCRNTVQIAGFTRFLIGLNAVEKCLVEGPEVEHRWYRNDRAETDLVAKQIRNLVSGGVSPDEIVVLSPYRLVNSPLRNGQFDVPMLQLDEDDPTGDAVHFATIDSYKGLEADAVIVVDISDLDSDRARQQLYVGLSRARAYLSVLMNEKTRDQYDEKAVEYGERVSQAQED